MPTMDTFSTIFSRKCLALKHALFGASNFRLRKVESMVSYRGADMQEKQQPKEPQTMTT